MICSCRYDWVTMLGSHSRTFSSVSRLSTTSCAREVLDAGNWSRLDLVEAERLPRRRDVALDVGRLGRDLVGHDPELLDERRVDAADEQRRADPHCPARSAAAATPGSGCSRAGRPPRQRRSRSGSASAGSCAWTSVYDAPVTCPRGEKFSS